MVSMASIYFRDEDRELVEFLKTESETPEGYSLKGNVIRNRLYDYMELKRGDELRQMARGDDDE